MTIGVQVELTVEEAAALRQVLETHLSEFRWEIMRTDSRDFRAQLKRTETVLKGVLDRLVGRAPEVVGSPDETR